MKLYNTSMIPPQDCRWHLSLDDFKKKHEKDSGTEFKSEEIGDRGKKRLETAFEKFKEYGVEARNRCGKAKVRTAFACSNIHR